MRRSFLVVVFSNLLSISISDEVNNTLNSLNQSRNEYEALETSQNEFYIFDTDIDNPHETKENISIINSHSAGYEELKNTTAVDKNILISTSSTIA